MGYIQMRLCCPDWQNQDFMVKVITQLLSKQGGFLNLRVLSAALSCLQKNCIDALIKRGATSMPLPGFLTSNQVSTDLLQKLIEIVQKRIPIDETFTELELAQIDMSYSKM